jgi:Protein of unknown function (DUF3224)
MLAKGTFEVTMAPLPTYNEDDGAQVARMSLDKVFRGDLEATSKGEMLSAGSPRSGSAGYVAIERVTGVLQGRRGSFSLQHDATMDRNAARLEIRVVPDSGTDALRGLGGRMTIKIADGRHSYEFEYELAA